MDWLHCAEWFNVDQERTKNGKNYVLKMIASLKTLKLVIVKFIKFSDEGLIDWLIGNV